MNVVFAKYDGQSADSQTVNALQSEVGVRFHLYSIVFSIALSFSLTSSPFLAISIFAIFISFLSSAFLAPTVKCILEMHLYYSYA